MGSILTVSGIFQSEKIIEKSRFITFSTHVESEDEAKHFISIAREKHPFATHVCYAYIADKLGNKMRFSDDNEPQGTAGIPILEVLKNKKLLETAVVVVRYFGGIKLGTGGLARAYSSSTAENLAAAEIVAVEKCEEIKITVDYPNADVAAQYIGVSGAKLITTDYGEKVCFLVAVKLTESEKFKENFIDRLLGKVQIQKTAEYYGSFKI